MLHLDVGLLTAQRLDGSDQPWAELYADTLAIAEEAERLGFDGVWVSEHHFTDDGYMSAVLPVLAAIAARTERVALGTNVALAPLYHPLRLAEDAAAVDLISGGRLLLGLAIGYRDAEFDAFGVAKRERVDRLVECVERVPQGVDGRPVRPRRAGRVGTRAHRAAGAAGTAVDLVGRLGRRGHRTGGGDRRRLHLAGRRARRHPPAARGPRRGGRPGRS